MLGGFGFINEMNKSLKGNKRLLDKAKESFSRRKEVRIAKNQDLKFNELSPEKMAEVKRFLEERSLREKRGIRLVYVSIPIFVFIVFITIWQLGGFATEQDFFEPITERAREVIAVEAQKLEVSFIERDYKVFKDLWYEQVDAKDAITHSSLHLFIAERNGFPTLESISYYDNHAEAHIEILGVDSLITAKYRFEMFKGKPVLTGFTIGDWPKNEKLRS